MKKENETRDHMMKTTTFSHTLKKKTWSNQGWIKQERSILPYQ